MSGETKESRSAWTTDSLKEKMQDDVANLEKSMNQQIRDIRKDYDRRFKANEVDKNRRFASSEKAVETAFKAANEAVAKSERSVEKRADTVYVTIEKLQTALAGLMPRKEAEERFKTLAEKTTENTDRLNKSSAKEEGTTTQKTSTRSNQQWVVYLILAAFTLLSFLIGNGVFKQNG